MSEAEDIRLALAIRWAPERYIEHAKRAYEKRTGRQASPEWVRALRRRMREAPIPNNPADAVGPEVIEALRRMRLLPQRAQPRASRVPAITDHIRAALERGDFALLLRANGCRCDGDLLVEWQARFAHKDLREVASILDFAHTRGVAPRLPSQIDDILDSWNNLSRDEKRDWWESFAKEIGYGGTVQDQAHSTEHVA